MDPGYFPMEQYQIAGDQWKADYDLSVSKYLTDTELNAAKATGAFSNGALMADAKKRYSQSLRHRRKSDDERRDRVERGSAGRHGLDTGTVQDLSDGEQRSLALILRNIDLVFENGARITLPRSFFNHKFKRESGRQRRKV